jgi:hypothetical protein
MKGPEIGTEETTKKYGPVLVYLSCSVGNARWLNTNLVILLELVKDMLFYLFKNY